MFFFFKQKTAYEMRISDWSSDVCSSDLPAVRARAGRIAVVQWHLAAHGRAGAPRQPTPVRIHHDVRGHVSRAQRVAQPAVDDLSGLCARTPVRTVAEEFCRSEEHPSELQ